MKPSDIKQLQYGDKVFWEDPDELRSQIITVKKAVVDAYNKIKIESTNGDVFVCEASQIRTV